MLRIIILFSILFLHSCASTQSNNSLQEQNDDVVVREEPVDIGKEITVSVCDAKGRSTLAPTLYLFVNHEEIAKASKKSKTVIKSLSGRNFKLVQKKNPALSRWSERVLYEEVLDRDLYLLFEMKRNYAQGAGLLLGGLIGGAIVDSFQDSTNANWAIESVTKEFFDSECEYKKKSFKSS